MLKIILNGAGGRMGRMMASVIDADDGAVLVAEVDKVAEDCQYKNLSDYTGEADCIVDFSHHSATKELVSYAVAKKLPLVIAPTGHTDEELALINEASRSIPLFFTANFSLGIAVLVELAKKAVAMFPDADVEIVEAHHNRKVDAPSGTAKMIASALREVRPQAEFVYGRNGMKKREKNEIGIHALRMGNESGMHEIYVSTDSQTLTLRHNAESHQVFADGALAAAKYVATKPAGFYNMDTMLADVK